MACATAASAARSLTRFTRAARPHTSRYSDCRRGSSNTESRSTSSPSAASTPTASNARSASTSRSLRPMLDDLEGELAFALELADIADAFTLPRFERQDFTLGWKDDRTEVTEADRGTEAL